MLYRVSPFFQFVPIILARINRCIALPILKFYDHCIAEYICFRPIRVIAQKIYIANEFEPTSKHQR